MSDQISILRQLFNSLSKEEQTNFLKSLNHDTKKVQTFESFKQSVIKHSNHPLQYRCCCPYYQYPKKTSAIFKQSLDKKVSLISWEHLSFLIKNDIKETLDIDLSFLWKFPSIQGQTTTVPNMENNYFDEQDKFIVDKTNLSYQLLNEFLNQSKQETIERCDEEKKFWELEKNEIHNYSKEQAINKLIDSLKINQKIEQIDKYQKDLLK